jgi:hypothetical protein
MVVIVFKDESLAPQPSGREMKMKPIKSWTLNLRRPKYGNKEGFKTLPSE